jgi:signal transduction histidine kinase
LPPREHLLGVMYIGIAEAREFGPRETRRLESLAERLGLHLENARLFAELHDTIESLHAEESLREHFVSTLAHDLRGPLSAARLASELLALQPAGLDERRDLAIKIDHNIERVDRMIRDLLDASRIRAGEPLPLRLDRCDLVALVHRIAEEARAMYGDRFTVEANRAVLGVWSEDDLHRSLWNLVANAVKYGAPNQPIALAVAAEGEHARISIHNKGTPIAAAEQAHIFEPYARSSSASHSSLSGWGLGLTLVRGVAEAHGGRVTLVSGADGTTFTIDLPLDARSARSPVSRSAAIH